MGKNVKKIIAMALAIGTVSALAPATHANILTTKAYASSDFELELDDEDGDSIDFYKDSGYDDDIDGSDLSSGKTYYAKASSDKISFDTSGVDDSYVRIYKSDASDSDDGYEVGDDISISSTKTFIVRVFDEDEDEDDVDDATYGNDDNLDHKDYKIRVEYNGDDDEDSNDYDKFDSLDLLDDNDDSVQLYKDSSYDDEVDSDEVEEGKTYYAKTSSDKVSFDVDGDVDEKYIKVFKSTSSSAKGSDIDDEISLTSDKTLTVRIYDEEPDSDVTYEDDDHVTGKYTIKVKYSGDGTEDDDSSSNTADSTPDTATNVSTAKTNQWVQANGIWQYNDSMGNPIKNSWFYDKSNGKNFYLGADGSMATGWFSYNGAWYYFGADGVMTTGWQAVGGTWYYLDGQGKMQIGWIKDTNGKYYYLNSNGSMAYNTTIGGYKLGADGAWTK